MEYTKDAEPPWIYNRWTAICCISALLKRNLFIDHGISRVFPNLYCMFIGDPGTRKSTSIKRGRDIAGAAGFDKFAHDKTTKEQFLVDLEGAVLDNEITGFGSQNNYGANYSKFLDTNLWNNDQEREVKNVFIVADEWNDFAGEGNREFYTTLGNLWDWDKPEEFYTSRVKNGRSVSIYQPTITLLGGNTHELFARAFPPEMLGTGFLSRLLLIHGERSKRQIAFPRKPSQELTDGIIRLAAEISSFYINTELVLEQEARDAMEAIYTSWKHIDDARFTSYSTRRFTQLLKLCIVTVASRLGNSLTREDVILANTVLAAAEANMPRALGQFGKGKNSDVTNKVMEVLNNSMLPMDVFEIWKHVHSDLDTIKTLGDIITGLIQAEKVQNVIGSSKFLPRRQAVKKAEYVDWSLLTSEEQEMV